MELASQKFEKKGELLSKTDGKALRIYEEFRTWLSQNNMLQYGKGMIENYHNYTNVLTLTNGDEYNHATVTSSNFKVPYLTQQFRYWGQLK